MSSNQTLFISYRREDSAGWAGRLQADLRSRLGPDVQVFMDIDGIPAGEDFAYAIDNELGRCDALVALIGPDWITAQDADGRRRLEDPNDFVRIEIEAALRRDIRVIPALVGDASLPRQDALPEPLRELIRRQAVKLDNDTWNLGLNRLVKAIDPTSGTEALPPVERAQQAGGVSVQATSTGAAAGGNVTMTAGGDAVGRDKIRYRRGER